VEGLLHLLLLLLPAAPPTYLVAHGGVFSGGSISSFSNSIVSQPTTFGLSQRYSAFAHGVGLMGEAGPEAIMPLTRLSGGDLGVKAQTGAITTNVQMVVNIENHTDSQVETQQSQDENGMPQLDVIIKQVESGMVRNDRRGTSLFANHIDSTRKSSRASSLYR
jgi:phage-related minor tail protein